MHTYTTEDGLVSRPAMRTPGPYEVCSYEPWWWHQLTGHLPQQQQRRGHYHGQHITPRHDPGKAGDASRDAAAAAAAARHITAADTSCIVPQCLSGRWQVVDTGNGSCCQHIPHHHTAINICRCKPAPPRQKQTAQ